MVSSRPEFSNTLADIRAFILKDMPFTRLITPLYAAVVLAFLEFWHVRVTGFSLRSLASLSLWVALCFACGASIVRLLPFRFSGSEAPAANFVLGFFVFTTLLQVLVLALPLSFQGDIAVAATAVLALGFAARRKPRADQPADFLAPLWLTLLVVGTGTSFWCADALSPPQIAGNETVFQAWADSFFHARQISQFANARGPGSLSDIQMAGSPPHFYHTAHYLSAAMVTALTGEGAYETFLDFYLPVGLMLTGLAAYLLGSCLWGPWGGLASASALMLLPDAYQQGFSNRFLSYAFMQQVNPGGLYGVACMALAWTLVFDGCRNGRKPAVALGWVLAGISLVFKAHIFVANALLILVYPTLFWPRLRPRWRLTLLAMQVAIFCAAVRFGQNFESVPTMRLDGSGMSRYAEMIVGSFDAGPVQDFFAGPMRESQDSIEIATVLGLMILVTTFGLWLVPWLVVSAALWRQGQRAPAALAGLMVLNYTIMALFLALDERHIGMPEELLNRPLVWAYFAVVVLTAGGGYNLLFGTHPPRQRTVRLAALAAGALCLAFPVFGGKQLQTFPAWKGSGLDVFQRVPTCLVQAARFVRAHSTPDQRVLDSENDPWLRVSALSERQDFVVKVPVPIRTPEGLEQRLAEVTAWKADNDEATVREYAHRNGITWFILQASAKVGWPESILQATAFVCDGVRVYRFQP